MRRCVEQADFWLAFTQCAAGSARESKNLLPSLSMPSVRYCLRLEAMNCPSHRVICTVFESRQR